MSTLWIAIDTDYNKEDSEYGKVFVAVDNVICAPRFYRFFYDWWWYVAHQVWLAFSKRRSKVHGVSFCACKVHQLSCTQVSPSLHVICNLLHSDPLIHCNLTKDSIVSELSWSSNSLARSLLYICIGKLLLVSLAKAWRCIGQCAVATCKTKCCQVLICAVSYKQLICIVFTQYRCTVIIPTEHYMSPTQGLGCRV